MDNGYIKKLKEIRGEELKNFYNDERTSMMMKEGDLNDEPYRPSTFLYIRAFQNDNGSRPIPPGHTYCLSPDIELYLNGAVVDTGNPLLADTTYTVKVTVTSDGDLGCNSCTVDLYLCMPSLGFSTKGGGLIGMTTTHVNAHSNATVEFPFATTKDMGGHRCMFARVYSWSSNDYPSDLVNFDTYSDRHIGQQNLNIVKQGETLEFEVNRVMREKGKDVHITLIRDNSLFERNQISRRFALSKRLINNEEMKFFAKNNIIADPIILKKRPNLRELLHIPEKIGKKVPNNNEKINDAKLPYIPDTKNLGQGKWMHRIESGSNKMKIQIPMLDLRDNEAIPMKLSVIDPETGESIGEITVIVVA